MNLIRLRNLYNCTFGRDPDGDAILSYAHTDSGKLVETLLNSDEYADKQVEKSLASTPKRRKFDYSIISINDRAAENKDDIVSTLSECTLHTLEYFDSSKQDYKKFYADRGIENNWDPGHSFMRAEPLVGEFGICGSQILVLEYMVKNNIPEMIVFEDDVMLAEKFIDHLNLCYADLPDNFDFLSDMTVFPNERFFNSVHEYTLIGSSFITRSHLQNAHLGFMLYSLAGAKKILALLKETGFFAPIDTMLFYYSRSGLLNGYSTFFSNRLVADKDFHGSMIDSNNIRR